MILDGYVTDKNNLPVKNATVEIKNKKFDTVYVTKSDLNGYYRFDIPQGKYPFLIAVKDYKVSCLEYWCQDIPLYSDMTLNVSFDTLEVYGLHAFSVKGAANGLMVYFRPMSLEKYLRNEYDIVPDDMTVKAFADDKECPVINVNEVKEFVGDRKMTAYLVQLDTEATSAWSKLDIQIRDKYDNYGAATIFNNEKHP